MSDEVIPNILPANRPCGSSEDGVLMYYDGPLLMWLPVPGRHLLAAALMEAKEDPWPFLVAELTPQAARDLLDNKLTLKDAYTTAVACYHMRDYGSEVLQFDPVSTIPEDWLPGDCFLSQ